MDRFGAVRPENARAGLRPLPARDTPDARPILQLTERPVILFDHGPAGTPALFDAPSRLVVAWSPDEVPDAFAEVAAASAAGYWLAGYASYELGYALEPRLHPLMPEHRRVPLLAFGIHDSPRDGTPMLARAAQQASSSRLGVMTPDWDGPAYRVAFERVADYIAAGDCYQINLTMALRARLHGTALGLYGALAARQRVGHGAFVDLGVGPVLLSRSPELFFHKNASGKIETLPMKGTAPRDLDPARDMELREGLRDSAKNRAENLMIVDLLRNDLSRICTPGTVRVPDLFAVHSFATVHQMVSRIEGRLLPGTGLEVIFRALFPCGSITGAPKIRAMQIIRELEAQARDVYCGAIGWVAPDGGAAFNVAIRTLTLFGTDEVVLNVGGGVVHDSTAETEYEEALWKARFALAI